VPDSINFMVECKSRGAYLMGLTTAGNYNIEESADFTVYILETNEHFAVVDGILCVCGEGT
jgi:glutamine---fructose-6-phosphate transaminase (isomerizing)